MFEKAQYRGPRFCQECGHALSEADYGKEAMPCPSRTCTHTTYCNAVPVSNLIIPYQGGILLQKRAIPPKVGYWGLPGGHQGIELWQRTDQRESEEELDVHIPDPVHNILPFWFDSTPDGRQIITFGIVRPGTKIVVRDFTPNSEVSDRMILYPPQWPTFAPEICFELHRTAITRYFGRIAM